MKQKLLFLLAGILLAVIPLRAQMQLVKDIYPDGSSYPENLVRVNNIVYFLAWDNTHGQELWKTDGTAVGTVMVKDIYAGGYSSNITSMVNLSGTLYFVATDTDNDQEIWKSDGTAAGTVKVTNLQVPELEGLSGAQLTNVNGVLYFSFMDSQGYELWKTDGTAAGTSMVKNIVPGAGSSYPRGFISGNGILYFTATHPDFGEEYWKSDGTPEGTVMIKDNVPGPESIMPYGLAFFKNNLYFILEDKGIYRTDGTAAGTELFIENKYASNAIVLGDIMFLSVSGPYDAWNAELWKTDGTQAGTSLVKVIHSSVGWNNPHFASMNNTVYFVSGNKLWKSDGSEQGTVLAKGTAEIYSIGYLTSLSNQTLLFSGSDAIRGTNQELWKYTPGGTAIPPTLISTSPTQNALSAAIYTNIGLSFSQTMDVATINGAAVKVYGSQTGLISGSFSGSSTIVFDPAKNFKRGEKVSVSVTRKARSTHGDSLSRAVVFDFLTAMQPANAQFALSSSIPLNNQPGSQPASLAVADFDGDGDADVAAVNFNTNKVSIRFNNGSGVLSGTVAVNVAGNPRGIVAADLDGDGDADLAVASEYSGEVTILSNNGTGQFTSQGAVQVGNQPVTVTAADFDGDGDLDLATANSASASLSVLFNNGAGQFGVATSVPVEFTPGSIQAVDLDNDGDIDLTNTNYYNNTVTIRWNDGKGNFSGNTSFVTGVNPGGVYPADVDGDGDNDLLVSNAASADVKLIKNNGDGSFAAPVAAAIPQGGLQVGDLDGDGDLDVASINPDTRTLAVRLNNGQGQFSGNTSLEIGAFPRAIQSADFNGDNELDLVVIDEQSTRVAVLLNGAAASVCQASGMILREYWAKVNGNQTSDVLVNKVPTSTSYLTSFEGPTGVGENYASRIRGYLCAPETGNYTFWIASDDYGDLYLSSDDNPANKQLIAYLKGYSNPRQYNKHYSQKSALIYLEKGKRYYIEALHKQGWVNDNLSVAWRLPSSAASASPVVIPGSVLSPFVPGNARMEYAEVANAEAAVGLNLQAAPNPFSHQTSVTFTAQESGPAVLDLYDLQGRKLQQVFNAQVQAGEKHQAQVNGSRLGQGLYLLRLANGSKVQNLKVLIAR